MLLAAFTCSAPALAATFTVTNTSDQGLGSLRRMIEKANTNPGPDTIAFKIPGAGVHTIAPLSELPASSEPLYIDGSTQPGFDHGDFLPLIELTGSNAGANVNGLTISGGRSTVRGLIINRFSGGDGRNGHGIKITTKGGNRIEGCFIGTNAEGTSDAGNRYAGVWIDGQSDNIIGGTTPAARNIISGNEYGVLILNLAHNNKVMGNYIGIDRNGTGGLYNRFHQFGSGVLIANGSCGNIIGGTQSGAGNVISDNGAGVQIYTSSARNNKVQGNFIGTQQDGISALGNRYFGITIGGGQDNIIGGTTAAAGNVIAANGSAGIAFDYGATRNKVFGNFIGTDRTATARIGNRIAGIRITTDLSSYSLGLSLNSHRRVWLGRVVERARTPPRLDFVPCTA